jgi:hypothetical protein
MVAIIFTTYFIEDQTQTKSRVDFIEVIVSIAVVTKSKDIQFQLILEFLSIEVKDDS